MIPFIEYVLRPIGSQPDIPRAYPVGGEPTAIRVTNLTDFIVLSLTETISKTLVVTVDKIREIP